LTWFRFFFSKKKISVWLLFLIKTEPNRKWSPLEKTSLFHAVFFLDKLARICIV
jgi:hypothetical protein